MSAQRGGSVRWWAKFIVLGWLVLATAWAPAAAGAQSLKLGIFAYRGKADTEARWLPLAEHLSRSLGVRIELQALNTKEIQDALRQNALDFVFTNPLHYVQLKQGNALSGALVTLVERQSNQPVAALGGVIVIRYERADIKTLADLAGKKIVIASPELLGAYAAQLYELERAGIPLSPGQFMEVGTPQDKVVQAVLAGSADVGFVRTGVLERMVEEGTVDPGALRVINRQELPGYPFQSSTRLYPEWPLVSMPQVDRKLARRVASALLAIEPDDAVARAARFHGFTIPADYQPVEDLMRELRLPPFDHSTPITWRDLWAQHGLVLASLGASVLVVCALLLGLLINMRHMRLARRIAEGLATESQRTAKELDQHRHHLEELVGERTRQYEAARDAAETANRAKSIFLANMSHEIRTPLNAIIGLTHLVQRDLAEPKQQQRLGKVGAAAQHLLAIINDILDLSKIEAGRLTLESTDFTLSRVIDEVTELVRDKAHEKSLTWQVTLDPALPPYLNGDPLRLVQVLINFASNAVKFTEQGSVTLAVTRLSAGGEPPWLRFALTDSGIGLSAEAVARLFQPFEQADMSTTRRFGGTGLGLAIVKRIADLMGGRVGVESTPGKGSTFWLEAPFGTGQAPVAAGEPAHMSGRDVQVAAGAAPDVAVNGFADHAHTRLLLAEDNPINQEVTLDLLDAVGLRADVAENGREAVECARTHCYALILMDVQMPELDGIGATRQIRALEGGATAPDVPIIAMTANVFSEDRRNCLDAGMSDHLPKPVTPVDFYRMLQSWLPAATQDAPEKAGGTAEHEAGTAPSPAPALPSPPLPAAQVTAIRLPDISGLDIQAGLLSVGGRTATYQRLLGMFVEHHADDIAQVRAALSAGQRDEARRLAHSLKGAASTLGAEPLRSAAAAAELAIKSGATDEEIEAGLLALEVPLDALLGGLRAFMAGGT